LISVYKDTQNKTIKKNIAHELKIDLKEFNKLYKKANIDKRKQNIAASSTDNQLPASKKDIDYKKVKEDILKAHQEKLEKQRELEKQKELDKQEEEIKTVNTNNDIYTVSVHSVQLKYDRNWKYTTAWL
jgi:FtsZ-interacting cell division protein ZipA